MIQSKCCATKCAASNCASHACTHADPLSRMAMLSAITIAEACPWCKVQYRPRIREGDKPPDPIVFGPCPPT